ncbi:hypothetical protein PTKIN_Ptkin19aG0134000 [Pterospermum kingtungense]
MAFKPLYEGGIVKDVQKQLNTNWDDVICPICLDVPHNAVLLQCSSYDKGCRPFVCDTDHLHSNCLDRFKTAYGVLSCPSTPVTVSEDNCNPTCPLCRGEVTGWIVVDKARLFLDEKKRCCEEERCTFVGTYLELQKHAQLDHPHGHPSRIDLARQLRWERIQQSSQMLDVLSSIQLEVPRGMVLGDYIVIESEDEVEDFPTGDECNWWTSCFLYQLFDNFRNSRNRRISRVTDTRRGSRNSTYAPSSSDEGSVTSVEFAEYGVDGNIDDEFESSSALSRGCFFYQRAVEGTRHELRIDPTEVESNWIPGAAGSYRF